MAVAVPLRTDLDAAQLRALAKQSRDADQTRRLLALAAIDDGASRTVISHESGRRRKARVGQHHAAHLLCSSPVPS